ncbi:serine/threonine-protein kinase RsbT [Verrucomicrobium sp. GAS474]|uniref:anti-sigma regulatory factor n=1 Tax=Verrucomicrobium sp. GAS474 TaxID=1882831 RepID=UPI00087B106B|nr:anti-sigma regulatory factor [Verrucomicrobium sp. GAS474]SDU03168.1 serine/threonine-protein kinase RsbT [Verrucomicrobium sp. GAS474]
MPAIKTATHPLRTEVDIVQARHLVRKWAAELAFSLVDQTKIVTAASELARNTIVYGKGGEMRITSLENGARKGLELVFADQGPGIADMKLALQDGYTTGSGLGLGLSGAKRLSNEFDIVSKVGEGTTVMIRRWK